MESAIRFLLRRRRIVLAAVLCISAAAAVVCARATISTSLGTLFLGESSRYRDYLKLTQKFGNDEVILVAVEAGDLFSQTTIARLQAVTAALESHAEIRSIHSALDLKAITLSRGVLDLSSYADQALANPASADALLQAARSDPSGGGLLISEDGRETAFIIEITPDESRGAESYATLLRDIRQAFADHGFAADRLRLSGLAVDIAEVMRQSTIQMAVLFPIVTLVLLVVTYLNFRRLWPVAIVGTVASLGVLWTMAVAVLVFERINILIAAVPIIIIVISFIDVIHLMTAYVLRLAEGLPKEEAIVRGCAEVGDACFYTSVTTFVGFASMALVPAPAFRQAGFLLGFGTALALLIALALTPVLLRVVKAPPAASAASASNRRLLIDATLERLHGWARRRPRTVVALFALVSALSVWGMTRVRLETDFVHRLSPRNRVRQDSEHISRHFGGTNLLDVFITAPQAGGMVDPATLARVAAFQRRVGDLQEVRRVLSLIDVLQAMRRGLAGREDAQNALPASAREVDEYLFLVETAGETESEALIDQDRRVIRLRLNLRGTGFVYTRDVGNAILALARESLGADLKVEVTGISFLIGEWLVQIIEGQERGLIFACLTITVMMALALRSLRAGLWGMIPNVFPLLVLGGYLGWFWKTVDSDAIIIAMEAVGIAVDDTIHFLMRLRHESHQSDDPERALARTYYYTGRPIVIATFILVAGFAPCAFSDYSFVRFMGTLLPGALVVGLVADLLLVPALVQLNVFAMLRRRPSVR